MTSLECCHLYATAISHAGWSGKDNEDRFEFTTQLLGNQGDLPSHYAVIVDGIGGHRAVEIAAEIAVEVIKRVISASDGSQPVIASSRQSNKPAMRLSFTQ